MKPDKPIDAAELRRQAEERLKNRRSEAGDHQSTQDTQRLLHELQVHQIEMEMRNDELQETRRELEETLAQYIDLYDFAPVGYLTLDRDGAIRRINLTGTVLIGVERSRLLNRRFGLFVSEDSRPVFNAFLEKAFEGQAKEACEIMLLRERNQPFLAHLETRISEDGQECRAVVADITKLKGAEERERHLNTVLLSIRRVNQLITKEKDRKRFIQKACESLVETRGLKGAWIILRDESDSLVITGESGQGECFTKLKELFEQDRLPLCVQKALSQPGVVVIEDISMCVDCPLASFYQEGTAFSVRLEHGGKVYGLLTASLPPAYDLGKEEQGLFEEVGGDIGFALYNLEQEEKEIEANRMIFEREERLRAIFEAAKNVSFVVADLGGKDARIMEFSPGAEWIFGYTREEAIGRPVTMLHRPEDIDRFSSINALVLEKKEVFSEEIMKVRKSGEQFPSLFSICPILNEKKNVVATLSVTIDIAGLKKTEESLRQSEERYRAIFEGAAEGIMIIEHHTRNIKYVNPAMCRMLGYNEDELKHLTVNDIHPAYILDRLGLDFEAHDRENKTMFQQDLECLKKDGTIIYADVVITPRIIIDGSAHSASFFLDITQKKKAEDDKKKMEVQLLQSQKLEAVGRLTGGIAHDFNNILTMIIGNAEIILMGLPKGDPMREGIEEIRAAGDRASSLTSQLLAFSRKQVLQPTIMSLNETVRDTDRMLSRILGEDIEMRTILAPDLGLVEADVGQIEQVIMNLAVNARDAMPRGGKIAIETANVELDEKYARSHIAVIPGPYVMLSVSDTGVGMTKEVQEHVFEPFFTTKEKGKGTGLGLSTVYGIVKQSKGNIWVYSELGKGTTFKVYLPRAERLISEKKKKDKKAEVLTGSETILIVEDDEMVRKFVERVLKGYNYRILIAADGEEAIRIAREHEGPIDLMLTDVVMPGMNGQEIEKRLRTLRPDIKVLYMSGYTDNTIVDHGVLDKGKAFLQKPFTVDALGRKVREALGK
jgi:two-component system cell cycle sensor histidine kinase/response regulator CckA